MATSRDMSEVYKPPSINQKRGRFIRTLPAEHQQFFGNIDRYLIQNTSLITSKRIRDMEKIEFIKEETRPIHVAFYEGDSPIDRTTRSRIHAYALTNLYDADWNSETNPDFAQTLGVLLTILATYTPYRAMVESGLETSLAQCHLRVEKMIWDTKEKVMDETKDAVSYVAEAMKINGDETPQDFTIVALSVLLLIGKNVIEANRTAWFRNRWRGLAKISGVTMNVDQVDPPLLRPCQALYTSASSNQPVRATIFRILRTLASIPDDQNHIIFDRLINLLQWAEMSHIPMIIEHIYENNPEVLMFPELNGPEMAATSVAISFLKGFPKEDRAFLKFLLDHNELKPLHSGNFTYFTAAAHAIASITKTSMLNINAPFSEGVKAFQARLIDYINQKSKIGALASGASYATSLPCSSSTEPVTSLDVPASISVPVSRPLRTYPAKKKVHFAT